jgi:hypothetical protein
MESKSKTLTHIFAALTHIFAKKELSGDGRHAK